MLEANTSAGKLRLYDDEWTAVVAGRPVYLTSTETDLLRALMASPGTVRTRGDLGRAVWGKKNIGSRAIDAHILRIRKKLGNDVIRAAYGAGYALAVPRGRSNKRVA